MKALTSRLLLRQRTLPRRHPPECLMSAGGATSAAEEADLIAGQAVFGCELIQQMGILLRLPQVAVSTAQVSFHQLFAQALDAQV